MKIFGVPFDPANSPERLNLKLAYLSHLMNVHQISETCDDPYDAVKTHAIKEPPFLCEDLWAGKMPVESWLTPKPGLTDRNLLTPFHANAFLEGNGCWNYALKVSKFVEERIFPHIPIMVGIDHSLTGGVLLALRQRYENLNVVILDAHFDVMDLNGFSFSSEFQKNHAESRYYHCGNFISFLLDREIIFPENLWVLGVAAEVLPKGNGQNEGDHPCTPNERAVRKYADNGVHLVSKDMISSGAISLDLNGPTYISIDMDVGSLASIFSARFMTSFGLTLDAFIHLLSLVSRSIRDARVSLAGLDIMEVDIHFMEALGATSYRDFTEFIAMKALEIFLIDQQ